MKVIRHDLSTPNGRRFFLEHMGNIALQILTSHGFGHDPLLDAPPTVPPSNGSGGLGFVWSAIQVSISEMNQFEIGILKLGRDIIDNHVTRFHKFPQNLDPEMCLCRSKGIEIRLCLIPIGDDDLALRVEYMGRP